MSHQSLLIILTFLFLLEFVAFGMKRTSLLISRKADVPPEYGALLLPVWFPAFWLVRIGKWGTLLFIALSWSWGVAIALSVTGFILLSFVLPIPYRLYVVFFRFRSQRIKVRNLEAGLALECMLNESSNTSP